MPPDQLPGPSGPAAMVIETHISWIFLTPDRAFKLMKPVRMPFLDYSVAEKRIAAAERELDLNRRIAPDVYLGLADVNESGRLVDRMIVMRRLPDSRRLTNLVDSETFREDLRAVARTVAAFHAAQGPVAPAPMATRDAVAANWADNFATIAPHVGPVIEPLEFERVERLVETYLDGRQTLFESRIRDGFVRDGHGDLIADDIFCLDDGPRIIDCLAFEDGWRIGDVLSDIAFLVMDVHRLAGPEPADALMAWYQEFSGERHPDSLAHHYVAYRSHVRAKVACLRHAQGDAAAAELARAHHRLALEQLELGRIRLVMVGGGPGTGKSTLARGLGDHYDLPVLATDEIRGGVVSAPDGALNDAARRAATPGTGIYAEGAVDAVYDEQLREAALLLDGGRGVVLDASWTRRRHRDAARMLAAEHGAELVELDCHAEPGVAKERVKRRMTREDNLSDATPEVVDHLAARRDPWPSATTIPTEDTKQITLGLAVAAVDAMPIGGR